MNPPTTQTQQWLQRAGQGDGEAVEKLLEAHRVQLLEAVRRRLDRAVSRRIDASDVVQDVLFEASRRLPDYLADPSMPFGLWLRSLARDRVVDMHRRHRRAGRRSVDREQPLRRASSTADSGSSDFAELRDARTTPAAAAMRREFRTRFLDALATLDPQDREILWMRHFEHMSNADAAQALGLTHPAAGMRYLRALRRVRAVLRSGDPEAASGAE